VSEIFAEADWYLARSEPEKEWQGVLRNRDVLIGPATRTALLYTFVTDDKQLPVYTANIGQQLAPYVALPVIVRGKLVDLSNEGFGQELWIGSIQMAGSGSE
jgi:hypothetical protein